MFTVDVKQQCNNNNNNNYPGYVSNKVDFLKNKEDLEPLACDDGSTRPRGYKTIFMLTKVEHEILNAHKCKNIKKFGFF